LLAFIPQASYLDADIETVGYIARSALTAPNSADFPAAK
jgi:hypothetical protein